MSVSRRQWYAVSSPLNWKTDWRWTKETTIIHYNDPRTVFHSFFLILHNTDVADSKPVQPFFYACVRSIAWLMIRPGAVLPGITFLRKLFWQNYKAIIFTDHDHSIEIRKCLSLFFPFACNFLQFFGKFKSFPSTGNWLSDVCILSYCCFSSCV